MTTITRTTETTTTLVTVDWTDTLNVTLTLDNPSTPLPTWGNPDPAPTVHLTPIEAMQLVDMIRDAVITINRTQTDVTDDTDEVNA